MAASTFLACELLRNDKKIWLATRIILLRCYKQAQTRIGHGIEIQLKPIVSLIGCAEITLSAHLRGSFQEPRPGLPVAALLERQAPRCVDSWPGIKAWKTRARECQRNISRTELRRHKNNSSRKTAGNSPRLIRNNLSKPPNPQRDNPQLNIIPNSFPLGTIAVRYWSHSESGEFQKCARGGGTVRGECPYLRLSRTLNLSACGDRPDSRMLTQRLRQVPILLVLLAHAAATIGTGARLELD
jgi:hypothetical protein